MRQRYRPGNAVGSLAFHGRLLPSLTGDHESVRSVRTLDDHVDSFDLLERLRDDPNLGYLGADLAENVDRPVHARLIEENERLIEKNILFL